MPAFAVFKLYKGFQSLKSLGGAAITVEVPVPLEIDLLNGPFIIREAGGVAEFAPGYAVIKNGGVWNDPANIDGRTLVSGYDGNVSETLTLIANTATQVSRAAGLSQLADFARAARDYWQKDWTSEPVYIEMQGCDAPGTQYAFVYDIQIAVTQDVLYNVDTAPVVTLTIEREPFWRMAVPPGMSPKVWTLYTRNLIPTNSLAPSATQYNYTHLSIVWTGAVGYNALAETSILGSYDELGVSRFNFLDVPAASIPGDAPALALISVIPVSGQPTNLPVFMVSRDTKPDFFSGTHGAIPPGSIVNTQKRNTLNAGDATITGAWAKLIDATGLLSNNQIVNRYVGRHNNALVAAAEPLQWGVPSSQWRGRYAVFVKTQVVAGTVANFTLTFNAINPANSAVLSTTPASQVRATGFADTFLGVIDPSLGTQLKRDSSTATDTSAGFTFQLLITKAAAVAVDLRVWDVVLMPIDEASALITPDTLNWVTLPVALAIDNTGVYTQSDPSDAIALLPQLTTNGGKPQQYRGVPISLVPGVTNRLYFMAQNPVINDVASTYRARVDIVPRVRGMRTV